MNIYSKIVLTGIFISIFWFPVFVSGQSVDPLSPGRSDGNIIRNIYINNIDVSGPSIINDGKDWQPDLFGKIGNSLHFKTRTWVIKNILLFKPGQKVDQQVIDDSERLLRKSGYFYDAKIDIYQSDEADKVNIRVTTKDKWTLSPQISYSPKNKNGYIGLSNKNFLGIGHSAGIRLSHSQDTYIGWGAAFDYTINNIRGSFVDASLNLVSNNKSNLFKLSLSKPFITARTKWAGGIGFTWEHDDLRNVDKDNEVSLIPHSYDSQDLWAGRSFPVLFGSDEFRRNSSFVLSGRYYRKHYRIRPSVLPDSNQIFENHRLYLVGIGVMNREFYKSYFVNEFGVTEDIPVGSMISLTTGSDSREFYNRWYYGIQSVYAVNLNYTGYFSGNIEIGGFRHDDQWEQNTVKLDFIYHSFLLTAENWKARFFAQINYIMGIKRFEGEQIYLDRASGMRGFSEYAAAGVKRNVISLEMRFFTPYNVLGFVVGGILFADYGLIAGNNQKLISGRVYQGYGFGLRTQNQSISRTNFEMALVYNPYNPLTGKDHTEIIFSAAYVLGSREFNFNQPEIIKFSNED